MFSNVPCCCRGSGASSFILLCRVRRLEARFGEESDRGGAFAGLLSLTRCSSLVDGVGLPLSSGVFGWRAVVVVSLVGRVFLCRKWRVFGLNSYPFWFESDLRGVISGLLLSDGLVFTCGPCDPPSPLRFACGLI